LTLAGLGLAPDQLAGEDNLVHFLSLSVALVVTYCDIGVTWVSYFDSLQSE